MTSAAGPECPAQQRHGVLDRALRTTRQPTRSPDTVDHVVDRYRGVGFDEQHRQHALQLCVPDRNRLGVDGRLDAAEQTEFHRHRAPKRFTHSQSWIVLLLRGSGQAAQPLLSKYGPQVVHAGPCGGTAGVRG